MSEQDIRERVAAIDAAPTQDAWTIICRQVNNTFIFGTERYGSIGIVWDALNAENNAEFIAHAPDDIRYLLAEVERLQTALAAVSSERDAAVAALEPFAKAAAWIETLTGSEVERQIFSLTTVMPYEWTHAAQVYAARQHDDAAEGSDR